MKSSIAIVMIGLCVASAVQAQAGASRAGDGWKAFEFLLGRWTWDGGGRPGQARGTSTFRPELDGTVLVRSTHLDYPATKERAAFAHDDLVYVYRDPPDSSVHPIFFDGEGHVIRYALAAAGEDSVQFVSEAAPEGTRCRMTYARAGRDSVTERFEIAPAGRPDAFRTYVEFTARRVGP